ncbi:uncharacterized protein LOC131636273 [Vicia villosa]|uniref:uncharacterized protein LOC131636273 n=1 Tax=Vicia villosa TaxID=3911 RepID=UPI00273CA752|nr:uncharacterized protein LOC131636273 [Vicia villosa]
MNRLEDIIGVVQEINNFQYNNSGKKSFVSLSLKDLKGVIVNCTLWESYGTKFLDFYHDEKNSGAIVIILTHAMIKESQVSNGWSGSKLLINEDIPEITEYLSKYTQGYRQMSRLKSLRSLRRDVSLDMLCVTVGTTQRFFVSKHGWFYYGCTKCSLKASDVNNPYNCSCGQNVEHAIPRYRVDIYVVDGDSKFRFVFWDTDCADIIGKKVTTSPMIYPDDLDMLLGKKMAFRAKVQPTFGQASVWKLSYDEEFVKEIEKDYITDEESLSAYGENDPDKIVTNTPIQRKSCLS